MLRTGDLVESEAKLKKENNEIIKSLSNNVLFIFASRLRYSLLYDTAHAAFLLLYQAVINSSNSQTSVLH